MRFLRFKNRTDEALARIDQCLVETKAARAETRRVRDEMEKFNEADDELRDQLTRLMRGTNA